MAWLRARSGVAALVVVGSGFSVAGVVGEHVPDDREQAVFDGDDGFGLTAMAHEVAVLGVEECSSVVGDR